MTSPSRQVTGVSAWAWGLLVLLPVPLLGPLLAGGGMMASYGTLARQGPVAKANAASARSWGKFFLILSTLLMLAQLALGLMRMTQPTAPAAAFFPMGIPITLYVLLCVVHLGVVIFAVLRARRGQVVRLPFFWSSW